MPMTTLNLREETTLPADRFAGALAARVWRPDVNGPSVVSVRDNGVFDVSASFPTMRDLCEAASPAEALRAAQGPRIGALSDILAHSPRDSRVSGSPHLLAPIDLQAVKAAGVTFAESLLERVIEERARGSREGAAKAREEIVSILGDDLSTLKPGSPAAMRLKDALVKTGAWSQYLEVGIGLDAEGPPGPSRAPGRNSARSASAPTPKCFPRASRCRLSEPAMTPGSMPPLF